MEQYEIMKEDTILGPFNINEIAEFVHSGLILKRDYAYNVEYPDSFRTIEFFLQRHGKKVSVEQKSHGKRINNFLPYLWWDLLYRG